MGYAIRNREKTMSSQSFSLNYLDVGDYLFREGDAGEEAYLIKSGRFKISKQVGDDSHKTIAVVGKGNIIGEMALIDGQPRAASAICVETATVVVVSSQSLNQRLEKTDPVILQLLNTFTRRLREQAETIARMNTY